MSSKCLACGNVFEASRNQHYCNKCTLNESMFHVREKQNDSLPIILIVEDTKFFAKTIGDKLTKARFKVIYAFDGEQALTMTHSCKPALILLDLQLPKLSGFELIEKIKLSPQLHQIPILVMSEIYVSSNDIQFAHKLGADGFIIKRTIDQSLLFRINQLLAASP